MKLVLSFFLLLLSGSVQAGEVYDRVMKNSEIKCAYVHWEPSIIMDPNTGVLSGIFYDLTNEIGRRLSLDINWAEEVGWATAIEGMNTNRYDAVCSNFWPTPQRARLTHFSEPVNYSPLYIWVRSDYPNDHAETFESLNQEDKVFTYVDGSAAAQVTEKMFPKAKKVTYPEKTQLSDMLHGLVNNKGSYAITDSVTVHDYLQTNPETIKALPESKPVVVKPNVMLLPANDMRFSNMIDHTIKDIIADGTFDEIIARYDGHDIYLPLAKPYEEQ